MHAPPSIPPQRPSNWQPSKPKRTRARSAPWPEDEPELAPYNDEPDPEKVGGYVVTGDLDHPDYDEEAAMGEPYRCAVCGAVLEDEADG